jgi:hypothetical protein
VNVISLSRSKYAVYFFVEQGANIVRKWFRDEQIEDVEWAAFEALLDIYESCGLASIQASTIDAGGGFFALKSVRRGGVLPCPIFRPGPFDEQTEITFLAGARWDERKKRVRPFSAVGEAEENLEVLLGDPSRRRRG